MFSIYIYTVVDSNCIIHRLSVLSFFWGVASTTWPASMREAATASTKLPWTTPPDSDRCSSGRSMCTACGACAVGLGVRGMILVEFSDVRGCHVPSHSCCHHIRCQLLLSSSLIYSLMTSLQVLDGSPFMFVQNALDSRST